MPIDKQAILLKALADIKALALQMKGDGMRAKFAPVAPDEAAEPDEGAPDEEAKDALEPDPLDTEAPPPDDGSESMDDDKIQRLMAMMGKK